MKELFSIPAEQLGDGRVKFSWSPRGMYLAAVGNKRTVNIYDRNGRLFNEVLLPPPEAVEDAKKKKGKDAGRASDPEDPCAELQWDSAGQKLAILPSSCSICVIWIAKTQEVVKLDTNMKSQELTWMQWSKRNDILAVGTNKGNLMLYNDNEKKKVPIMGKHTRRITCGAWSNENVLAMGGDDNLLTVTTGSDGDTIKTLTLKLEPHEVMFNTKKDTDSRLSSGESTISINVGQRSIYLIAAMDPDDTPIELAFQERYGNILRHGWYGDGYIVIGFQSGQIVVVSTHNKEMSEEIHSASYLTSNLVDLAISPQMNRAAIAGTRTVKVIELGSGFKELPEESINLSSGPAIERIEWTDDGQVITLSTRGGEICAFLATLPVIHSANMSRVVYLTNLQELCVEDVTTRQSSSIRTETEPSFLGIGPSHVAVGMNNQAWFYRCPTDGSDVIQISTRDYMGTVSKLELSDRFAAVFCDGHVSVHEIEPSGDEEFEWQVPGKGQQAPDAAVTAMGLTSHFLVCGTSRGTITYYMLEDGSVVNEFRHDDAGIARMFPQPDGTRLVFEDDTHAVMLYNPVNDQVVSIPEFNSVLETMLWDCTDANIFTLFDSSNIYVYTYHPVTINGPEVQLLCTQTKNAGLSPIALCGGTITGQLKNGSLEQVMLDSHRPLQDEELRSGGPTALRKRFDALVSMRDLKSAWEAAINLKSREAWGQLCDAALSSMDVDLAIWIFRHQQAASMVMSLERIRHIEDKNLLAGHILVLKDGAYDTAQELFLRSSYPKAALEMRRDLKHWDEAMKLAEQMDPDSIGAISLKYAGMLEVRGDYPSALDYFQQAQELCGDDPDAQSSCLAGIARCTIHQGDIRRGRQIAMKANSPSLCRECGAILEGMNQMQDAAEMYEKGGMFEKAASIYIQNKSFQQVAPLMAKISSPKLHLQYAKAKEGEGKYAEAVVAYEAAGEMDAVIRLNLERLNNPHKAFAVVRKTKSSEGASLVANFCVANHDFRAAIEFLLFAKRNDEAFELAQTHDSMDAYVEFAGSGVNNDDWIRVARFYEMSGKHDKAGDMWTKCGHFDAALRAYIKGGSPAMDKAIAMVGRANNPSLTNQLVDYLMGETDGEAKDHNFLFKLHMALGDYEQAAQTSVLIAKQEQEMGNYKLAHSQLLSTYCELRVQKKHIPAELTRNLMLLHSYILVKSLAKNGDHEGAARMLMRVARNISKFPEHVVPILTSTVIECQRAGFKKTAFEYASMLVRPEYRNQLRPEYKRKIENMVRKPDRDAEDPEEQMWPCPFCRTPGPETELDCSNCRDVIPFCLATGKRCISSDWARCPECGFNCRAQDFIKLLQTDKSCPMCSKQVSPNLVAKIDDPVALLKREAEAVEQAANEPEGQEEED